MRAAQRSIARRRERGRGPVVAHRTPVAKYWACKRAPLFVAEALECHGGNGFIADHLMERLYREAPLNGIWEGTGNVICLDVLRAMQREPAARGAFSASRAGAWRRRAPRPLRRRARAPPRRPDRARAGRPPHRRDDGVALQASLLLRHSTPAAADAFCATRLDGDWGSAFGTLPAGLDARAIVDRCASRPEAKRAATVAMQRLPTIDTARRRESRRSRSPQSRDLEPGRRDRGPHRLE